MVQIKTYQHLGEDLETSFACKRMAAIDEKRHGLSDEPHRHNFYTIIFALDVKGQHHIDFHEYEFQSPCVFFVSPGQVHQVVTQERPEGYALLFTQDFLIKNDIRPSFITDLNLFRSFGESPPLTLNKGQKEYLVRLAEFLSKEYEKGGKANLEKLGALLKLFLIECSESCQLPIPKEQHSQGADSLLKRFRDLVEKYYRKEHQVAFYAEKLYITPGHLNKSVKALTDTSAKEFVQKRITTEAKRLALFSRLSSKEIAFELGFDDPAHFSSFFKKCTGQPLTRFRKSG